MSITASRSNVYGTCGVGVFHYFREETRNPSRPWAHSGNQELSIAKNTGGADWAIAGFIKGSVTKAAYNQLKDKYKIVFQSPVRNNRNSGNQFFMVLYDSQTRLPRPRWVGKSSGAPKPEALVKWEENILEPFDNSQHFWPWES